MLQRLVQALGQVSPNTVGTATHGWEKVPLLDQRSGKWEELGPSVAIEVLLPQCGGGAGPQVHFLL
jgi:hypothetical protein